MTRSTARPRKRQKWLGRLLGCFSWRSGITPSDSSSSSGSDGEAETSAALQPDLDRIKTIIRADADRCRAVASRAASQESDRGSVVLLAARGPGAAVTSPGLEELDWALMREGLLEYRDPGASAPVLSICHGFSDTELALLSKRTPSHFKGVGGSEADKGADSGCDKRGQAWAAGAVGVRTRGLLCQSEPLIDGLPASVWLECVEPTLSILVSLNTLRHRRSNLSLKKGVPETLDSSRSRHGDFELGPIAILHHPGRVQQMMLLRFDYINALNQDMDLADLNQSAEQNRRNINRHRRHRDQRLEDIAMSLTQASHAHRAPHSHAHNTATLQHSHNTATLQHSHNTAALQHPHNSLSTSTLPATPLPTCTASSSNNNNNNVNNNHCSNVDIFQCDTCVVGGVARVVMSWLREDKQVARLKSRPRSQHPASRVTRGHTHCVEGAEPQGAEENAHLNTNSNCSSGYPGGAVDALVVATAMSGVLIGCPGQRVTPASRGGRMRVPDNPGGDNRLTQICPHPFTGGLAACTDNDVMARGDPIRWPVLPISCPSPAYTQHSGLGSQRRASYSTNNRHWWSSPRGIVLRARGAWSRWRSDKELTRGSA